MTDEFPSTQDLKAQVERSTDAVRGGLRELGSMGREVLTRQRERAVEMEEDLEAYVQDHPIRSMLMAAGVGIVIGALISRR